MSQIMQRLQPDNRIYHDRALQTFPEVEGNLKENKLAYLSSLLDIDEESDNYMAQDIFTTVNYLSDAGYSVPQSVLNSVFFWCLKFPQYTSDLKKFTKRLKTQAWLYHAIENMLETQFEFFKKSILESPSVWEFIIDEFEQDLKSKQLLLENDFSKYQVSLLIESLIYSWEPENKSLQTIPLLVTSLIEFCTSSPSLKSTNGILSILFQMFPNETYELVCHCADRLNTACIQLIAEKHFYEKSPLEGDKFSIAEKMLPFNIDLAKSLIEGCSELEVTIFNEMKNHFNEFNNRFVPE
ncbi:hypothetical protein TVAG_209240 [Trichomonas vaginalis G3]|uniref:Uncharacterized protein n=1 Tax=Trichomonas vaginalis (strain ATCC PRA-98 / G3) TaxID=412133 RepID=A2DVG6_TRIV3|nr:hypothetical protein TVAGG3_0335610 [Trichomonas vaginalis G3]EAY15645.1 hypothetical protein TVAG_209240 [Trichomonas vaginalis G3]KAI5530251.1 hypothetical protein TVAGG3_0335610 [Trichomonas vaginalis G3]|eukprot:XP_001327868.1 hypothetical protein [Trichomonas vaginalis G3]